MGNHGKLRWQAVGRNLQWPQPSHRSNGYSDPCGLPSGFVDMNPLPNLSLPHLSPASNTKQWKLIKRTKPHLSACGTYTNNNVLYNNQKENFGQSLKHPENDFNTCHVEKKFKTKLGLKENDGFTCDGNLVCRLCAASEKDRSPHEWLDMGSTRRLEL